MENQPIQFKKVTNPTSEDLHFTYNNAPYVLKAGETKDMLDYLALHAAKKLADKNILTNDPQEHRVFVGAYLQNSEPEVIAKNLGINLGKIREESLTKEKEKAKVSNLESLVLDMKKELDELKGKKEVEVKEEIKEEVKEEVKEEPKEEVKEEKKVAKKK